MIVIVQFFPRRREENQCQIFSLSLCSLQKTEICVLALKTAKRLPNSQQLTSRFSCQSKCWIIGTLKNSVFNDPTEMFDSVCFNIFCCETKLLTPCSWEVGSYVVSEHKLKSHIIKNHNKGFLWEEMFSVANVLSQTEKAKIVNLVTCVSRWLS